jgi:hypothetical protein
LKEFVAKNKESAPEGQKFEKVRPFQVVRESQIKGTATEENEERDLVEAEELFHASQLNLTGFQNL